jgi:hypothetical protein
MLHKFTIVARKWGIGFIYIALLSQMSASSDTEFLSWLTPSQKFWFKIFGFVCVGTRMYLDVTPARSNDAQFNRESQATVNIPELEATGLQAKATPNEQTNE